MEDGTAAARREFARAQSLFARGDLAAAIACCERLLHSAPQHTGTRELLGISLVTLGRRGEGIEHLRHAVREQPERPELVLNLATALCREGGVCEAIALLSGALSRFVPSGDLYYGLAVAQSAAGDKAAAIESYRSCVLLAPRHAEALNNLGALLERADRLEEALECFDRALAVKPGYLRALTNAGTALCRARRHTEALTMLRRALAASPRYVPAVFATAQVLFDTERFAEAARYFEQVIELQPAHAHAPLALGKALAAQGDHTGALRTLDLALALSPERLEIHLARGQAQQALGDWVPALHSFDRAIELAPDSAEAWNCRGLVQCHLGDFDAALASYDDALRIAPGYASARWNQALLYLLLGRYVHGWPLFEARFEVAGLQETIRRFVQPRWTGQVALRGRSILIHAEYGLGDTLHFSRYVLACQAQGAAVTFAVQPSLVALIRTLHAEIEVLPLAPDLPHATDFECPLLSLPLAFGTEVHTIPAHDQYLSADPVRVMDWGRQLPPRNGRKRVGIAWCGNLAAETEGLRGRSIPLVEFAPLAQRADIELISLQKGAATRELQDVGFRSRVNNFSASLDTGADAFLDTAAIIQNLDLVITCDTAIAHLAGALGVPVWVGLHTRSEWRWLRDRSDSPWYPTMTLFRQQRDGEWSDVFRAMNTRLS